MILQRRQPHRSPAHTCFVSKPSVIIEMSFYYNYTGPYPGTLRQNQANQTAAGAPQEPVNPWLVPAPQSAPAPTPAPATGSNSFYYYPRYDPQPAPVAQPAAPVNPWLAPAPVAPKASFPDALMLHTFILQTATDDPVHSPLNQRTPTSHRLLSITPVILFLNPLRSGMDQLKPRLMLRTPHSLKVSEPTNR